MSFYNKYRPKVLEEIDNSQVRKTLMSLLSKKKGDLPHAYLFTGSRGTGKTTAARIVAKLFNCTKPKKNGEPCGTCEMCLAITNGTALDILEIDAASNTGVDNIRDLKDKILLAPVIGKWKMYIIDEVHMLSTGAFNALLKTLEEPPQNTVFILATTDPQKVPETIKSRCLVLHFQKPHIDEIVASLERITKEEKIEVETSALKLLAEAADGSFRDATKLLEQASLASTKITKEIITEVLKSADREQVQTFINFLKTKDTVSLIAQIEKLEKEGIEMRSFYTAIIRVLQNLLVSHLIGDPPPPVADGGEKTWNQEDLRRCVDSLHQRFSELRGTNFPSLVLELAVLDYCMGGNQQSQSLSHPAFQPKLPTNTLQPQVTEGVRPVSRTSSLPISSGALTVEQLLEHWNSVIDEVKKYNHSTAGVLRSTKPKQITGETLIIETLYSFHKDKLSEPKAREAIIQTVKTLFGATVMLEIVLGKK